MTEFMTLAQADWESDLASRSGLLAVDHVPTSTCVHCGVTYGGTNCHTFLSRHLRARHGYTAITPTIVCGICDMNFSGEMRVKYLEQHMNVAHTRGHLF